MSADIALRMPLTMIIGGSVGKHIQIYMKKYKSKIYIVYKVCPHILEGVLHTRRDTARELLILI